jgi:cell division protein FtsW
MDIVGRLPFPAGALRGRRATPRRAAAVPSRQPVRATTDVLRRERHQPDYSILLAVVALAAIGILMVFSSSAMFAYASRDDTLAIVGPQIFWGALGIGVMLVTMRLDYRWLRMLSVPAYLGAVTLLILVFVPSLGRIVGGSARWLVLGPLPAVHPAEIAKLALIVYLAHWLANRGPLVGRFKQGMVPFLLIAGPVIALVF